MEGNPVTEAAKATGGILPLGGTPQLGAYKGFGLTVLVDILCSTLSGGFTVPEMNRELSARGKSSHFFGALRIENFMPVEKFKQRMDVMIKAHHNLPRAAGVDRICLAGEVERETERKRKSRGIPLHPAVVASLKELAEDLGIDYNL